MRGAYRSTGSTLTQDPGGRHDVAPAPHRCLCGRNYLRFWTLATRLTLTRIAGKQHAVSRGATSGEAR